MSEKLDYFRIRLKNFQQTMEIFMVLDDSSSVATRSMPYVEKMSGV